MNKGMIVLVLVLCLSLLLNVYWFFDASVTGEVVRGFDTYTSAVCESNDCHDEVFVSCDGTNVSLGVIAGSRVEFEENWTDPRK